MMTEDEILQIEKRCNSGTPGPWKSFIEDRDHNSGSNFIQTSIDEDLEIAGARIEDYEFIANAKQDIPNLIKEIRRLKDIIKKKGQEMNNAYSTSFLK